MTKILESHPRAASLKTRDKIAKGVEKGITSSHGLIAHGRGEAFDYLIGERTQPFAEKAIEAAAAMLITAEHPIISVNGNVAALVPDEMVELAGLLGANLEVNIFHTSKKREQKIRNHLLKKGAKKVLMPDSSTKLDFIAHNRKYVNPEGIKKAEVVFVPLEDGDRCEALIKNGKKVITIDLNPMSRTARAASVTIIDNICRCSGLLVDKVKELNKKNKKELKEKIDNYKNNQIISESLAFISDRVEELAKRYKND